MRKQLLAALTAATIGASLVAAPPAQALPAGCVQQPWMIVLRMTMRTICDSKVAADGSWLRARWFYAPETWVPMSCSRYSCTGGYWLNEYSNYEEYPVTDATVLPDEPGWIIH